MTHFALDPRLEQDCHFMAESETSQILLLDNALYNWFVLVPKVNESELHELSRSIQQKVLGEVMRLSCFIKEKLGADKINTAAIGNIVNQLHVHVIGRRENDATWPAVVWGTDAKQLYDEARVSELRKLLSTHFG